MNLHLIAILAYAGYVLCDTSIAKDYYDAEDEDDKGISWKVLFTKLDTILIEVNKMNKFIHDIEKRQEQQENQISKLVKFTEGNAKYLIEINKTNKIIHDMEKRQGEQEKQISKLMKFTEANAKYVNKSHMEIKNRLYTLENLAQESRSHRKEWTTILRRQDGSVNFYRNWTDYKTGFGNPPNGEFFIGLEELHEMTTATPHELIVVLKDWKNEMRSANYTRFRIGSEEEKYALELLGTHSGDTVDALDYHRGMKFSTFDEDNDDDYSRNCAKKFLGAWWFKACYDSHLTGPYRKESDSNEFGVSWDKWYSSFKFAEMKIRPKSY